MVTRLCAGGDGIDVVVRRRGHREDLHPRRRPRRLGSLRPPGHRRRARRDRRPGAPVHRRNRVHDAGDAADRPRRRPHPPRQPDRDRDRREPAWRAPGTSPRSSTPPTTPAPRSCWSVTPTSCPRSTPAACSPGSSERLDPIELTENRRQRDQWERDALEELRCGDVDAAFAAYRDNDRIVSAPTAIDVRRAMVADWWAHRVAGDTTAMVAYRRNDVDDLNGRARAHLTRTGQVTGPELVIDDRPYPGRRPDRLPPQQPPPRHPQRHPSHHRHRRPRPAEPSPSPSTTGVSCSRRSTSTTATSPTGTPPPSTRPKAPPSTTASSWAPTNCSANAATSPSAAAASRTASTSSAPPPPTTAPATAHHPAPATPSTSCSHALHRHSDKRLAIDTGEPLALWPIEHLAADSSAARRWRRWPSECP